LLASGNTPVSETKPTTRWEKSTYDEAKSNELIFPSKVITQVTGSRQRLTGILGYKYYGYKGSEHCPKREEYRERRDEILFAARHMF